MQVIPMKVVGAENFVARTSTEGASHQFLRELVKNSIEAGASRVQFSPEWVGVRHADVYRLLYADDGRGMSKDELSTYMNSIGLSSKPVGALDKNFGMGFRTSSLGWNRLGILVLSWQGGEGHAALLGYDEDSGAYGLIPFELPDGSREGVASVHYFPELAEMRPALVQDHGTVFVFYGNHRDEDTYWGPGGYAKGEQGAGLKYIVKYLNQRFYRLPCEVRVSTIFGSERERWPKHPEDRSREKTSKRAGAKKGRRERILQDRIVKGAEYYIRESATQGEESKLNVETGTVQLSDGTEIDWFYRHSSIPDNHALTFGSGFIGVLYDDELYETRTDSTAFRNFAIYGRDVLARTTLILRPPIAREMTDTYGVFPTSARDALRMKTEGPGSIDLPWALWQDDFARSLPKTLVEAIQAQIVAADQSDDYGDLLEKIASAARNLWRQVLLKRPYGSIRGTARDRLGSPPRPRPDVPDPDPRPPTPPLHEHPYGDLHGEHSRVQGGIPTIAWKTLEEMGETRYPVQYTPPSNAYPSGLLICAKDHPFLLTAIKDLMQFRQTHQEEEIRRLLYEFVGLKVAAWVVNAGNLMRAPEWTRSEVREHLWSPDALMCAYFLDPLSDMKWLRERVSRRIGRERTSDQAAE